MHVHTMESSTGRGWLVVVEPTGPGTASAPSSVMGGGWTRTVSESELYLVFCGLVVCLLHFRILRFFLLLE